MNIEQMIHKIINTEKYLLVVDDSEIKGWYYDSYINKVKNSSGAEYGENSITKSIIAHLPLNDSPTLEGVPLLPPLEKGVWTLPVGIYVYAVGHSMFMPSTGEVTSVSDDWVGNYVYEGNLNDECFWNGVKKEGESCTRNNGCTFPKCMGVDHA